MSSILLCQYSSHRQARGKGGNNPLLKETTGTWGSDGCHLLLKPWLLEKMLSKCAALSWNYDLES